MNRSSRLETISVSIRLLTVVICGLEATLKLAERLAYIAGTLLLGVLVGLVLSGQRSKGNQRRAARPIEDLAQELGQAWASHHTR